MQKIQLYLFWCLCNPFFFVVILFFFFFFMEKSHCKSFSKGLNQVRCLIQGQDNLNQKLCFAGASSTFPDSEILKCLLSASIIRAFACAVSGHSSGVHNCQQPAGHLGPEQQGLLLKNFYCLCNSASLWDFTWERNSWRGNSVETHSSAIFAFYRKHTYKFPISIVGFNLNEYHFGRSLQRVELTSTCELEMLKCY